MSLQRQIERTTGMLAAAALGLTVLAANPPTAHAAETGSARGQLTTAPQNQAVDVNLTDASLSAAIKMMEQKTGLSIVFLPSPQGYSPITVSLKGKPVVDALTLIAQSAGADIWQRDGVYFIGPKGSAPKPAADPEVPKDLVEDPIKPPVQMYWEKIPLVNSEPQALLYRMGVNTGPLGDLSQRLTVNILKALVNPFQNPYNSSSSADGGPIRELGNNSQIRPFVAPAAPIGNTNSNIENLGRPADAGATGDQTARRDAGDTQEFGRGQGFGGRGGGGGGFGGQQGGFGGQQGGFGQQGGIGAQGGQGGQQTTGAARDLMPEGIQNIYGYEVDNSIVVRGTPDAIRDLKEIIRFFDVAPKQVMVRAEFITVSQNDQNSFGINWSFSKVNLQTGVNTGFSTNNTAFLTFATGNLQTQISWILTTGRGKLVAAPTVTTFNNQLVPLSVGETVPVFISTPIITQSGTTALSTTIVTVPVFTSIIILPRINADNSITLLGTVSVQATRATVTGPDGETAPIVSNQQVTVQRRIRNGDTMVIGGLVSKNDQVSQNKVPLLGDLPLIGNLFKSRSVTTADSELLVFITPSIIPERGESASTRNAGGGGLLAPGGAGSGPGASGGGLMP